MSLRPPTTHDIGKRFLTAALALGALTICFPASASLAGVAESKLVSSNPRQGATFGHALALNGNTLVVGAWQETVSRGAVYVFVNTATGWMQEQRITAADGEADDRFGYSVALDGDTLVVGAYRDDDTGNNAGAAYVYVRDGTTWSKQEKLSASTAQNNARFGSAVGISGETLVVGCDGYNDGAAADEGTAYVFIRQSNSWSEQHQLDGSDTVANDELGGAVAIDGDTLILGTSKHDTGGDNAGAAYVFKRDTGNWSEQSKLMSTDIAMNDRFAYALAIEGDTALVGAYRHSHGADETGAAYVFTRSGDSWAQSQELTASDALSDDQFGSAVALAGQRILIGARNDASGLAQTGAAYLFTSSGGSWIEEYEIRASDAAEDDLFGQGVGLSGDVAVISAQGESMNRGAAYAYDLVDVGASCQDDSGCASLFCIDGVCCDNACGGGADDCQACSVVAGSQKDGVCALRAADSVCRVADNACDMDEVCTGDDIACPADLFVADGTSCDDGDSCTEDDSCSSGMCLAGGDICGAGGAGGAGGGGTGGASATSTGSGEPGSPPSSADGCGCRLVGALPQPKRGGAWALLLACVLSAGLNRRRR